eukprot:TRINITY_DN64279_c0_g1_i1.p1 TRINITY_DN64279_c0_g1~~TRINITY_DN64279_c0_g1_i1.p1  ORF type:complete len:275 (+),score=61.60 TRINITY_DN64279_c0_g1_i1:57-881(+)
MSSQKAAGYPEAKTNTAEKPGADEAEESKVEKVVSSSAENSYGQQLLQQDFSKLEQSLEAGLWEVDGDNLSLYVCTEKDEAAGEGKAGAVIVTAGDCGASAEILHLFKDGKGAQVSRLTASFICEEVDVDSDGTFTIGLAFEEDIVEASLLAVTLRRPRPESKLPREPGDPPEEPDPIKPVCLQVNGQVAIEELNDLPTQVDVEISLSWGTDSSAERCIEMKHRFLQGSKVEEGTTEVGFYTTNVKFNNAKVLFCHATGSVKVRLVSMECFAAE